MLKLKQYPINDVWFGCNKFNNINSNKIIYHTSNNGYLLSNKMIERLENNWKIFHNVIMMLWYVLVDYFMV